MSAFGLEGAPYLFSQTGTFPAPYTFTVPATLEVRTDMASASFDGSGASGAFLPAISFYSPSGVRLGTFPCQGTPLAMGASAEVTWFPLGLAASSAAAPGGGIQFDTSPQAGDWLYVETTNATGSPVDAGVDVHDSATASTYGVLLRSDNNKISLLAGSQIDLDAPDLVTITSDTTDVSVSAARFANIFGSSSTGVGSDVSVDLQAPNVRVDATNIGFFGGSPAAQPATPVTLGDVIAALQSLGLVA